MKDDIYQAPNSELLASEHQPDQQNGKDSQEANEPQGIGGWLIIVALGLIIAPFRISYFVVMTYPTLFTDGTWDALTNEASNAYSPLWAPIILCEIIGNTLIVIASIYLLISFFSKKANFPKWYAGLSVFSMLFIITNAYTVTLVLPNEPMFDPATTKELARALVSCLLWTPYLFISKRSKNTFIR